MYPSHVTPEFLGRMLPSLSAPEPFVWMYSPDPGADTIGQVLDYLFCFHYRIEGVKTPWVFWRYKINKILSVRDIVPDDAVEVKRGQTDTAFLRHSAWSRDCGGGSSVWQPENLLSYRSSGEPSSPAVRLLLPRRGLRREAT